MLMNAMLDSLVPQILSKDSLILSTENDFASKYISMNYKSAMTAELSALVGHQCEIIIVLSDIPSSSPAENKQPSTSSIHTRDDVLDSQKNGEIEDNHRRSQNVPVESSEVFQTFHNPDENTQPPAPEPQHSGTEIIENAKTFDNFVVASTNSTAYQTSFSVAEKPGIFINPLFIYGRSGLGKTHLLLAIKDYVNKNYPNLKVTYSPLTGLMEDYIEALGSQNWNSFSYKYRTTDVLLLDDVQYLERAEETANEFFKIFNQMVDNKKQIVLSADRSPKDLNLHERFTSRFLKGVLADIQEPRFETKLKIFQNHIDTLRNIHGNKSIEIPTEVINRVVELSNSNIRSLEGAAASLIVHIAYGREDKTGPITVEEAEEIVSEIFFTNFNDRITISDILNCIQKYYKVTRGEILGSQRPRHISQARQVGMYLSRVLTQASYVEIGRAFNKDHSSVVHAYKNIENKRQKDRDFANEIDRISDMITSSIDIDVTV